MKNIFISYGHKDASIIADKINEILKAKGYETWIDREEINSGNLWSEKIQQGIESCDTFIVLVTPHAFRNQNAICINELNHAKLHNKNIRPIIIIKEGNMEIPILLNHIHCLDISDKINNELSNIVIEEVIYYLEKGINLSQLKALLNPKDFSEDLNRFQENYEGRVWLYEYVSDWINNLNSKKILHLEGAPGFGKSAFFARIVERNEQVIAWYMCSYKHSSKNNPETFLKTIAYQMASRFDWYLKEIENIIPKNILGWEEWAEQLIYIPFRTTKDFQKPFVIAIDGLDEEIIDNSDGGEIAKVIFEVSKKLSSIGITWIKFILTSREDKNVRKVISDEICDRKKIDEIGGNKRLNDDIKAYLLQEIYSLSEIKKIETPEKIIASILEKAQGNFMYVVELVGLFKREKDGIDPNKPDEFPLDMFSIYSNRFEKLMNNFSPREYDNMKDILGVIACAKDALSIKSISQIVKKEEKIVTVIMNRLETYFPLRNSRYEPFHKSIIDWLNRDQSEFVYPETSHQMIAEYLTASYKSNAITEYSISFLPQHLIAAKKWKELDLLLKDLTFFKFLTQEGIFIVKKYWQVLIENFYSDKQTDYVMFYVEELRNRKEQLAPDEYLECILCVGNLLDESSKEETSEMLYEDALKFCKEKNEIGSLSDADIELRSGINKRLTKKYDEAIPHFLKAIEIRKHLLGEKNGDYAVALYRYATLLWEKGSILTEPQKKIAFFIESQKYYSEALNIMLKLEYEHPDLPELYNDFSVLNNSIGNLFYQIDDLKNVFHYYNTSVKYCKSGIKLKASKGHEDIFAGELYLNLGDSIHKLFKSSFSQSLAVKTPLAQTLENYNIADRIFKLNYGTESNWRISHTLSRKENIRLLLDFQDKIQDHLIALKEPQKIGLLNTQLIELLYELLLINKFLVIEIVSYSKKNDSLECLTSIPKIALAVFYFRQDKQEKSEALMEEIIEYWKQKSVTVYLELIIGYMTMLKTQNNLNKSKYYYSEYIDLLPEIRNQEQISPEVKDYLAYLLVYQFYDEVNEFCNAVINGNKFRHLQNENYIFSNHATAYYKNGKFENACEIQLLYVNKLIDEANKITLINNINTLGLYFKQSGSFIKAKDQYTQALNMTITELERNDKTEIETNELNSQLITIKGNLASLERELGNYYESLQLCNDVVEFHLNTFGKDKEFAFNLIKRATVEILFGEYSLAVSDLEQSLDLINERYIFPTWNKAYALEHLGFLENILGHHEKSIQKLHESESDYKYIIANPDKIYSGYPIERDLAELRIKIGKYYYYNEQKQKALEYFTLAYNYLNTHAGVKYFNTQIAKIFQCLSSAEDLNLAVIENEIKIFQELIGEGDIEKGRKHLLLAEIYLELGKKFNSEEYLNLAIQITDKKLAPNNIIKAKENLYFAKLYDGRNELNEALIKYSEAQKIFEAINYKHPEVAKIKVITKSSEGNKFMQPTL